uniref:Uncharacterized protein n=1 Tax=Zea mays TaxID=4577 RepID=B4FIU3_MAIZE|nr:unknown [Zea mays]
MEIQHHRGLGNSKVVKVQSEEAWDLFTDQASNEGRPVGVPFLPPPSLPPSGLLLLLLLLRGLPLFSSRSCNDPPVDDLGVSNSQSLSIRTVLYPCCLQSC